MAMGTRSRKRKSPADDVGDTPDERDPAPPERMLFDPDGDLVLHVGTELDTVDPCLFRVCSASLRRASPVWKAMFFGPFTEARPPHGDWVVALPEDNPETLGVLLEILHGGFAHVPTTVSLDFLCGILVVADKYDLFHLIRPFVNKWAEAVEGEPIEGSYDGIHPLQGFTGSLHIKRIYAAWELGLNDWVTEDLTHFIYNVSKEGTSFFLEGSQLELGNHSGPPDLLEIVSTGRLGLIQSFLDFYHAQVDCRMPAAEVKGCIKPNDRHGISEHLQCNAIILGGIWQYLHCTGTGFLPKCADEYGGSANSLIHTLRSMTKWLPSFSKGHDNCRPNELFRACESQAKMCKLYQAPLQPHHEEKMESHRERCGLSPTWMDDYLS